MANKKSGPTVLGVYLGHDLGACLLQDGQITAMIEEERLNRFKHGRSNEVGGLWGKFAGKFGYFPWASISYCLSVGNLSIDDVDAIVLGDAMWAGEATETIQDVIPIKDKSKIIFISEPKGAVHHFHHGLSGFLASPFEEAATLVVDGDGNATPDGYEAETGFYFTNRYGQYKQIFKNRYTEKSIPRSGIGWLYEQVSLLLGFANTKVFISDAGKTMGLSSYGRPRAEFESLWIKCDGFNLDFSGFHNWMKEAGHDLRVLSYQEGLATRGREISQYAKDLAYKAQAELEKAMLHLVRELQRATKSRNLCMAGGVALNSVANGVIAAKGGFENIFIQPAANDGGQAIGLAYHGHLLLTSNILHSDTSIQKVNGHAPIKAIRHNYSGKRYRAEEIRSLLDNSGLPYHEFPDADTLAEDVAQELAGRRIVGWFQGGSEYGPRALGHRSILANPDRKEMQDWLNSRVKFREEFRPFAPSVLLEKASEVFEMSGESPYMLLVVPVREAWKSRVPAITHVDGTARVQTVNREVEPLFHKVISTFERKTGIPLVLNTSFNLRGMPIVEAPFDAFQCFLYTDMDCLYMEQFKVSRPAPAKLVPMKLPDWEYTAGIGIDSARRVLVCQNSSTGRQVTVNGSNNFFQLLEKLDGSLNLLQGYEIAYGPDAEEPIERVICQVQGLVRQGLLQFRVGNLLFKSPKEKQHFWQSAVQKAAQIM